jgi:hypothetical protein
MKTHHLLLTTSLVAASLFAIAPASAHSVGGSGSFGGAVHASVPTYSPPTMHATPSAPSTISVGSGNGGYRPYVPPAPSPIMGSTTYGGRTTVVTTTGDVSITDGYGRTTTAPRPNPPPGISVSDGKGGWQPYAPPAKSNELGSTTYGGETRVVTRNADGSHTVTATDANGKKTVMPQPKLPPGISVDDGKGGWKPYTPPAKSNELGSTTYGGETRVVTRNADGTHTVTTTDANGKKTVTPQPKLPQGTTYPDGKGGLVVYKPMKSDERGSTVDGKVVVKTNGDVVRTDESGKKTVTPKVDLPKGTTIPDGKGGLVKYVPKKSSELGSTTHDGETRVVTRNPDGTLKTTVTPSK